ncbi:cytidine deaminase [Candidatus Woesearchaeota archaeon]|nr:cytidine deaminase [Candidatus Woesearchaeota archaeon]
MTNEELIKKAKYVVKVRKPSDNVSMGDVGCALITEKGNLYLGISIDCCSGIGFCAEAGAIAAMVTKKEYKIKKIVAVSEDGKVLPPCGRCREFIYQIDKSNLNTDVIIRKNKVVKLKALLPERWQERL